MPPFMLEVGNSITVNELLCGIVSLLDNPAAFRPRISLAPVTNTSDAPDLPKVVKLDTSPPI